MKLTAEKRKAAEMDNELRRGQLHREEDIEAGIQTMCINIRNRLLILPAKLSPELAAAGSNQSEIYDIVKRAIAEALDDLKQASTVTEILDNQDEEEKTQ